jgi:succinate dehydrogenase / fumarate reductase iron-sulfur subunit
LIEPLIKEKGDVITVAPMTKFALIRDLIVDRSTMFEALKKVHAWVQLDRAIDRGPGPKISPAKQEVMYKLSTCMSCGCCLEACPQVNEKSAFIGAAAISQARLFNIHPIGKESEDKRMEALMKEGGIANCGNAQNCVKVCPKKIPLTESIDAIGRETTLYALKNFFSSPERS